MLRVPGQIPIEMQIQRQTGNDHEFEDRDTDTGNEYDQCNNVVATVGQHENPTENGIRGIAGE
jgi:hypothetical protein